MHGIAKAKMIFYFSPQGGTYILTMTEIAAKKQQIYPLAT